jgi:hypothetical protein
MRCRPLAVLLACALLMGACTSQKALPEPVEVETCEGLEDVGVRLLEVWIEVVDQIPFDDILADPPSPEIQELARIGSDLDARATRLNCDSVALNNAIRDRIERTDDIDPQTPVGVMLLEMVEEGLVGSTPQPPPSASTTTVTP